MLSNFHFTSLTDALEFDQKSDQLTDLKKTLLGD